MSLRAAAAPLLAAMAACSATPLLTDLAVAERAERAGHWDRALDAYERAQSSCRAQKPRSRRQALCAQAHLARAELLDRLGRRRQAARAYEAIPAALADDPEAAALATYRAGAVYLTLGDSTRAWVLLSRTVAHYPDQAAAADALRLLVRDGRRRNSRALYHELARLAEPLAATEVGDNVLFALAVLAEEDLGDSGLALALHDRNFAAYPQGPLRDDVLWHGARLARAGGDPRGAVSRLRKLLAGREVAAFGAGSYFSVWFDNAQLELGRILRDDLGDYAAAAAAFARLPVDYPASLLRDDALWELAKTWERGAAPQRACRALAELGARWPDSKYELERAPTLRRRLGCPRR